MALARAPSEDGSSRGERALAVLMLEDSPLDAQLIEAALEDGGLTVRSERVDSRGAFQSALRSGAWAIVLADYNVPSFDGTEALAIARELAPSAPFIFVSGALGDERAIELLKLGATDYVLKDRLQRLVPSIRRALSDAAERSQRRRAETALAASERRLANLMSNMPGMAFRCAATEPWIFEYASAGASELTGYPPEDFYDGGARDWGSLIVPEDRVLLRDELARAAQTASLVSVRYRIMPRSGAQRWVWHRAVPVANGGVHAPTYDGWVTDITQEVHFESEQRRQAELEQQLIGIVSHDLRNPLNVISLAASTVLMNEEISDSVARPLLKIQSAGNRAARMIRDLLDFTQARLGGGIPVERKRSDIREIVQQVVEEMETTHPGRKVSVIHVGSARGEWDPDRLGQAIGNLVANALRHSLPGSHVSIRTDGANDSMELEVHNVGEPIPDALRPRLFQPFHRGDAMRDRASRSVGLGLYIVDHIVRAHGGEIDVRSSLDEGTTFRLVLPTASRPA